MLTFDEYSKNFENNLNEFLQNCPDATELDFIELEIYKHKSKIDTHERFKGLTTCYILISEYYTSKKIIKFLNDKEIEYDINRFPTKGKLNIDKIEKYFLQLTNIHSDYPNDEGELICVLSSDKIKELIHSKKRIEKLKTLNFSQSQLRTFIYYFKEIHKSKDNELMDFVNLEIDNFEVFIGLSPKNEYSNFNKGEKKLSSTYESFLNSLNS